ncbi:hypothetical protein QGN32_08790 [Mycolicibacterium sp. ND9-15]|uniref:hypothetical protein n=1 Tax=Mycolicibacterium sp. ND9-15 TaxID=3042320 RepID=UPI002DD883B0|nr:hypothetical protein [Mycolicibacterium sp. ND9-15]WSE57923.1 hypothetical protein QGN32_08790 [Mycolicibacterium sp. ND9-15]
MSTDDTQREDDRLTEEQRKVEPETDEHHQVTSEPEKPEPTDKPEVTDEHREKAKEMHKAYEEDRPTTKMPGTGGAVAGTAVNDWLDDDGNPRFSKESASSEGSGGS